MDKVKFLMSDTSAEVTAACREALELKGVEVTVVEKDGLKVLQKMLSVRPQVVLLDAFMPGLDALAVKQKYNAAGERHTAFFVTGAFQSEEMVQELLAQTGGIVQGMNGSPIVQNGRLVGAVTHVLVNDPTRGYGIFAQTMLEQAERVTE